VFAESFVGTVGAYVAAPPKELRSVQPRRSKGCTAQVASPVGQTED
jgi:hypothetical protein